MPTIETRVTGLYFDAGDRIGLTVMMDGSGPYVENRMMTYNGSTFTSPGFLWYNDLNVTSTLTAYYPYSATGTPEEFTSRRIRPRGVPLRTCWVPSNAVSRRHRPPWAWSSITFSRSCRSA